MGALGTLGPLVQAFHHVPATGDVLLQHEISGLKQTERGRALAISPMSIQNKWLMIISTTATKSVRLQPL